MLDHSTESVMTQEEYLQVDIPDNNDPFYLANKTFYTTCHKISRQNNPSFRKKPPYTFLENWLIHSLFSKSQQILLRFPVIHPRVMMTEGDFIYTPHQMMNNTDHGYYSNQYEDEEDEEEYYDDDTFIIGDEGVIVMSAPAPDILAESNHSIVMDENTWMGHSKYNGNGLTLHVVNPDLDEEEDHNERQQPIRRRLAFRTQLQMVAEEEEEEEEEEGCKEEEDENPKLNGLSMSPEILNWYRSTDLKSMKSIIYEEQSSVIEGSNITTNDIQSNEGNSEGNKGCMHETSHEKELLSSRRSTSKSYQSLADMIFEEEEEEEEVENREVCSQQISTTTSYGTVLHHSPEQGMIRISGSFVNATWAAIDIAQAYHEDESEKNLLGFASCVLKIWKELIFGVGPMLNWRGRIKLQTSI
jgi:hypothetical protein